MKRLLNRCIACLLCLVLTAAVFVCIPNSAVVADAAETEPVNMLSNGDFESRATVPGWDLGDSKKVNLAHGDAKTGELALRIDDDDTSKQYSVESNAIPVIAGCNYAVSVYVKGAAGAQVTLRFFDVNGSEIATQGSATLSADAIDWTLLTASVVAPSNAKTAKVYLSTTAECTGTVLFDDALLDRASEPVDLITNGTFENGLTPWGKAQGGTVEIVEKSATDSSKVLKVNSVQGSYTVLTQNGLSATAGQTYVLSFDYKLNLTSMTVKTMLARVAFFNSEGTQIGANKDFDMSKVLVKDWTNYTTEITAPEGTVKINFAFYIWSTNAGEIWIDNVSLLEKAADALSNTSFEETATVPNWTISGSGEKQMAISAGDVHSGDGAIYVKDNSSAAVNVLSDPVALNSNQIGHEIQLSYYIRGLGAKGTDGMVKSVPAVFINFYDDAGQLGTETRVMQTGSYPYWSRRSMTGVIPEGATYFRVWISYGTSTIGDVLIDDISVATACNHDKLTYTEKEPTSCTKPGKESAFCSLCQQTIEREIPQLDHIPDAGVIKSPASCELTGVKTYTCTVCGTPDDQDYPADGHKLKAVPAHPATATANGNIAYWVCEVCDKYFADAQENEEIYDKASVIILNGTTTTEPQETQAPTVPADPNKQPPKVGNNTSLIILLSLSAVAVAVIITTKSKFIIR